MAADGSVGVLGDLHSHLVPGVDDGARTAAESLEGVGRMVDQGYGRIVTTPHLDANLTLAGDFFEARMDEMTEAWRSVSVSVAEKWPELDFRLGFEVRLDVPDGNFSDERLRLGDTRFVLVEWSGMQVPPRSMEVLGRLRLSGLTPVLAHPERYSGIDRDLGTVARWREAGAYLQVNNGSLVGRYGPAARTLAFRLLKRGWADYLSTDFHGRPHLSLHTGEVTEALGSVGGEEQLKLLMGTNPRRLFDDLEPLPVPPLSGEKGLWGRVRELWAGELD
ncbi:MAG: hypothetical protein PVI57_14055 [Gemmatimonadota bacterium]|jgi:protein-tyrosine phosphatase